MYGTDFMMVRGSSPPFVLLISSDVRITIISYPSMRYGGEICRPYYLYSFASQGLIRGSIPLQAII